MPPDADAGKPGLRFEVTARSSHCAARLGRLRTKHGVVETPFFMPVGTAGSVKTVSPSELRGLGYQALLSNTYHLALRPGADVIERLGGLHAFMAWDRMILTDSGGFQVMSLSKTRTISDGGVVFRSHLDGSEMHLTPERSVQIQSQLGVDISMSLDECPPYPCTKQEAIAAMNRTHLWAPRNLAARGDGQSLFGIVQGGIHEDLRRESADFISSLPFDGIAVGGVSVGEPTELQYPVVDLTVPLLPESKPRYLMGVGHPADIIHAVACGVDMFDCVLPTRMARHHCLYTMHGRVNVCLSRWTEYSGPVDEQSVFPTISEFSAAYLRHLFKSREPLGARIATLHNLAFYSRLMADIRTAIAEQKWPELLARYADA